MPEFKKKPGANAKARNATKPVEKKFGIRLCLLDNLTRLNLPMDEQINLKPRLNELGKKIETKQKQLEEKDLPSFRKQELEKEIRMLKTEASVMFRSAWVNQNAPRPPFKLIPPSPYLGGAAPAFPVHRNRKPY